MEAALQNDLQPIVEELTKIIVSRVIGLSGRANLQNQRFSSTVFYTREEVGNRYGVSADTVATWIRNGELRAVDTRVKVTSMRNARWKISQEAIDEFERLRGSRPKLPPAPRRGQNKKPPESGKKWF